MHVLQKSSVRIEPNFHFVSSHFTFTTCESDAAAGKQLMDFKFDDWIKNAAGLAFVYINDMKFAEGQQLLNAASAMLEKAQVRLHDTNRGSLLPLPPDAQGWHN
jgi:hypothetical protein